MSEEPEPPRFPTVAVMGAGAVGCYFGGMLARAGAAVTLIGRSPHVEAIAADGLLLDTHDFSGRVMVEASHDVAAARGAELVLVAVKTYDTEAAARALAPHLGEDASSSASRTASRTPRSSVRRRAATRSRRSSGWRPR